MTIRLRYYLCYTDKRKRTISMQTQAFLYIDENFGAHNESLVDC
jgi:hypothetical protein